MYHYVYKTLNLINGHYYIGVHSTSTIEDGYIGSGQLIKYAIKKYGKNNFSKEIMSFHNTRDEALGAEKLLITDEVLNDPKSYNLIYGGANTSKFGKKDNSITRAKKSKSRIKYLKSINGLPSNIREKISNTVRELHKNGKYDFRKKLYKKEKLSKEELSKLKSINSKNRWNDDSFREKMKSCTSGENHHKFSGYYNTPHGRFPSASQAAKACNTDHHTVKRRCLSENIKFKDWYFEPITAPSDSNV